MGLKDDLAKASEKKQEEESAVIKELRSRDRELAKAKAALKTAKIKLKQSEEELELEKQKSEIVVATSGAPKNRRFARKKGKSTSNAVGIVCLTDWHVEETIDPATVNDLNAFTLDIADARIRRTFDKSLDMLQFSRGQSNIKELWVWLGGDFITGYIHEELEESNSLSPPEAVVWLQDRMYTGLKFLAQHADVDRIRVIPSWGNHARTNKKTRISTRAENTYEWILYHNLARAFNDDPTVEFKIEKGYHNINDWYGYKVRFHHGDGLRYNGGVGGITIPVNKSINQWNKATRCDLDVFGHYHQFINCRTFVSVGCLIGYSPYALEIKAEWEPPTQSFIVIDKHYGKVLAEQIFCEEAK
jgi:hypothetical protein